MPIFMYDCTSCDSSFEELFMSRDNIKDVTECHFCDDTAKKREINRFRHVGPVFEGLDEYTTAFGSEMKTYKQITEFEEKHGMTRIPHDSRRYQDYREQSVQEVYEISDSLNTGGYTGCADHITKKEMQDGTGWSDMKYSKWKATCDTTEAAARAGTIDISQKATAALPAKE